MTRIILLLLMSLLINGCTMLGVGTAEVTGISLFNDRRDAKTIVLDEKIEHDVMLTLNLDSAIRDNSHFNATSYNGIVLITGETVVQELLPHITETVQYIDDIRAVQNQMLPMATSSFSSRYNDSVITTRVKMAFTTDHRLSGFDATRIKVVTEYGRVFLMGLVYKKEGDVAADIASQQEGVQAVIKVFEYI